MIQHLDISHLPELIEIVNGRKKSLALIGGVSWSKENLSNSVALGHIWGIIYNDFIVSFVSFRSESHAIEVDYLATHLKFERKGYMLSVFKYLKGLSKKSGKPIWLEVSINNYGAISLYEKIGFVRGGQRLNYYKNGQAAIIYSYNP